MALELYNNARSQLDDWETAPPGTYQWAGFKSGSFDITDDVVDDLVPGTNEITVTGYARVDVDSPTITVNDVTNETEYRCTTPNFGTLDDGEPFTDLVLIKVVTDDSDSIPIARGPILGTPDTGDFDPFVVPFPPDDIVIKSRNAA